MALFFSQASLTSLGATAHLGLELIRREGDVVELNLLVAAAELALDLVRRHNRSLQREVLKLGEQQLLAKIGLELGNGQVLLLEHGRIDFAPANLPSWKSWGEDRADSAGQVLVGDLEAHAGGLIGQRALADHLVDVLRDHGRRQVSRNVSVANGGLQIDLHVAHGERFSANFGHDAVIAIASSSSGTARNQVGHHGQRYQHQQPGEQVAYRLFPAAKQIKHLAILSFRLLAFADSKRRAAVTPHAKHKRRTGQKAAQQRRTESLAPG